jgi:hypothetical protein
VQSIQASSLILRALLDSQYWQPTFFVKPTVFCGVWSTLYRRSKCHLRDRPVQLNSCSCNCGPVAIAECVRGSFGAAGTQRAAASFAPRLESNRRTGLRKATSAMADILPAASPLPGEPPIRPLVRQKSFAELSTTNQDPSYADSGWSLRRNTQKRA